MYQISQELTASLYEKRGQLCIKGTAQGQNEDSTILIA